MAKLEGVLGSPQKTSWFIALGLLSLSIGGTGGPWEVMVAKAWFFALGAGHCRSPGTWAWQGTLQLSPLGNTRVPNPLPPWEIRTLGDTQPGSGRPLPLQDPQSLHSPSPGWMELQSRMCLVRAVPSAQSRTLRGRGLWRRKAQGGQVGARDGGDSAERVRVVRWDRHQQVWGGEAGAGLAGPVPTGLG